MTVLQEELNELDASGLIRMVGHETNSEYQFRHVLTQEAAYGSLLKQDRRRLHAQVGMARSWNLPFGWTKLRRSWRAISMRPGMNRARSITFFARPMPQPRALPTPRHPYTITARWRSAGDMQKHWRHMLRWRCWRRSAMTRACCCLR